MCKVLHGKPCKRLEIYMGNHGDIYMRTHVNYHVDHGMPCKRLDMYMGNHVNYHVVTHVQSFTW